ncbi:hypothetical protein [Spiroplasma mirum]|uniref:hypothetical protein n=1 Tax=Spiroplasma mirum TaxID=2144 RepID=UPI00130DB99D|nr:MULTISPECIES: hypothetical protein [Spiroplasma]
MSNYYNVLIGYVLISLVLEFTNVHIYKKLQIIIDNNATSWIKINKSYRIVFSYLVPALIFVNIIFYALYFC